MFRVVFYRNENGVEFVRDWLKYELPMADRQIIGENLATLQEGFPMIGMPLIKPMATVFLNCVVASRISESHGFCFFMRRTV